MQWKTLLFQKLISIKTDSNENGFNSIYFRRNLNLKPFVKVQEKTKVICSNVNYTNEKHRFRKVFVRLKLNSEDVYVKAYIDVVKAK